MKSPDAGGNSRRVYLLVLPLQCYYQRGFDKVDIFASHCQNKRVPFKRLQHWAVQVGDDATGEMYEVTSYNRSDRKRDLNMTSAEDWRMSRKGQLHNCRKLFITVTACSSEELENIARSVWDKVLEDQYRAMSRNCQSFAELFKGIIETRELITEEASTELDDMPNSFNPLYAIFHLKQAKSLAARFTKSVLRRMDTVTSDGGVARIHSHSRLPGRRSNRWLELVNEASRQHELRKNHDVKGMVHEANRMHRSEKMSTSNLKRRTTWA